MNRFWQGGSCSTRDSFTFYYKLRLQHPKAVHPAEFLEAITMLSQMRLQRPLVLWVGPSTSESSKLQSWGHCYGLLSSDPSQIIVKFYWFSLHQLPGHQISFLLPLHPHLNPITLCLPHSQLFSRMNLTYSASSDPQFYGNHNLSKLQTIQCFSVLGLTGNSRRMFCL